MNAVQTAPKTENRFTGLVIGALLLIALTLLVSELDKGIAGFFQANGLRSNPLEYPLVAVAIGLIANLVLRLAGLYHTVRPAIRTELFLKIGLVILGARISLGDLLAMGVGGLIQACVMVVSVFFFAWWLGGRFKLPNTLKAIMASAVSICGVSAAIAAAGSVQAKKEEVTYITALVILVALPLMVIMPFIADALNLSPQVAGAWFGGNIDTTAAVVGAGTVYGAEAQAVASVVKLAQNVLIGFVSFALAFYFITVVNRGVGEKPSPRLIWERFPKFVIGFVLVSILASLHVLPADAIPHMNRAAQWAFTLAFVSIGIDFSVAEVRKAGWRPLAVYLGATVFNTVLALIAAYVIFGVLFPPAA